MKCQACSCTTIDDDIYCGACRKFKDHMTAVKDKMNIRQCPNEWGEDGMKCEGEMRFHNRYWRIGYDDDRMLIHNVWICQKCGELKYLEDGQMRIDEYKPNQISPKSKVSK